MIERFSLTADIGEIAGKFGVQKIIAGHTNRYNIAPTQVVSIVMNDRHKMRVLQESRWGLFPFWAKDSINVDHAALPDKAYMSHMLKRQRCIVPISGFYGARLIGKEREPRALHTVMPAQPLLAVAGIYDCWRHVNGKEVRAFTMLTAATTGAMSVWQPRVPVVLDEEGIEDWLNPGVADYSRLRKHLEAPESYMLRSYPVTNAVRDEWYEAPDCIREIAIPDFA